MGNAERGFKLLQSILSLNVTLKQFSKDLEGNEQSIIKLREDVNAQQVQIARLEERIDQNIGWIQTIVSGRSGAPQPSEVEAQHRIGNRTGSTPLEIPEKPDDEENDDDKAE